ncbi:MAG TPA: FHA domain-containing protein [Solirubrobacteraceae bacterium]|nr:FHA domain-containing protein [Solirubrobacteraceae bacterium]
MQSDLEVMVNPDFLALGLGGTNMMAMLWTVASGRQAVGVEMRGDPFLGVHWNIREALYHQLGLIDRMMLERYGAERVPRRGNGKLFRLAEVFYSPDTTGGDIVADVVIDGFDTNQHIVGRIHDVEFIDDRFRHGLPNRVITVLPPPVPPDHPDPAKIRGSMVEVLDSPSTFQAEAASIQRLLRRYLELLEETDVKAGVEPRVQLYTHHRALVDDDGFYEGPGGRKGIRIESLREFDFKGQFVRTREPGSEVIDLGVPELFMIAEGFSSKDASRLGFEQHDVEVNHNDGRGPVVAQADFVAGLVEVLVGGRLRRRISSEFDQGGQEYWVRQIAIGHENDPEAGWVLAQVPDFKAFDPVAEGLVPAGTEYDTPEFYAATQHLLYEYYIKQAADVLDIPRHELKQVQMIYGPKLFSLIERVGDDPLVVTNGVVAGDSFGNGHFLTSGGAMTGMVGHGFRVLDYWRDRAAGATPSKAIRELADAIKEDTQAWLQVSAKEYSQAVPVNFGAERAEQIKAASGADPNERARTIEAARRQRHALVPLNPSDWRRPVIHNGKVISELPELEGEHPLMRSGRELSLAAVMDVLPPAPDPVQADRELTQIRERASGERLSGFTPAITRVIAIPEQLRAASAGITRKLSIGELNPQTHAFLYVLKEMQVLARFEIKDDQVVGRSDSPTRDAPDIDLEPFDTDQTLSRRHARIRRVKGGFEVEDLGSLNHTELRGEVLSAGQAHALKDGEKIRFGSVDALFRLFGTADLPVPWPTS